MEARSFYFDHEGSDCEDSYHRRCNGRRRCELNLGKDGQGKRGRRKVSARSKSDLYQKLDELCEEVEQGSGHLGVTRSPGPSATG